MSTGMLEGGSSEFSTGPQCIEAYRTCLMEVSVAGLSVDALRAAANIIEDAPPHVVLGPHFVARSHELETAYLDQDPDKLAEARGALFEVCVRSQIYSGFVVSDEQLGLMDAAGLGLDYDRRVMGFVMVPLNLETQLNLDNVAPNELRAYRALGQGVLRRYNKLTDTEAVAERKVARRSRRLPGFLRRSRK